MSSLSIEKHAQHARTNDNTHEPYTVRRTASENVSLATENVSLALRYTNTWACVCVLGSGAYLFWLFSGPDTR